MNTPWRNGTIGIEFRFQDDEPNSPGESEFEAALEVSWTIRF